MSSSPEAMAMADDDLDLQVAEESDKITQLKSALWLSIGQLVDEATLKLSKNATPHFIGALTELTWHQLVAAAVDVEAFARHAGRTTVTTEDVLLLARRNHALKGHLEAFLETKRREEGSRATEHAASRGRATGRGRGRGRGR